jgi:hypothetical protein
MPGEESLPPVLREDAEAQAAAAKVLVGIFSCSLVALVAAASLRLLRGSRGSRSVSAEQDEQENTSNEAFLE